MSHTALLIDTSSLYTSAKKKFKKRIDYQKLLELVGSDCLVSFKRAYGVCKSTEARDFITSLTAKGFETNFVKKVGDTRLSVDIAVDTCKLIGNIDKIIICTSDRDILPLVKYLISKGIRVVLWGILLPTELKKYGTEIPESIMLSGEKNEASINVVS